MHKVLVLTGRMSVLLRDKGRVFFFFSLFMSHKNKHSAAPNMTLSSMVVWEDGSPRLLASALSEFVFRRGLNIY